MALIPRWMLRHTAIVEPYLGEGGAGPRYGPAVAIRCFAVNKRQLVRGAYEDQVVSQVQLFCRPTVTIPAHSRVTVGSGSPTTVIDYTDNRAPGWPTPDHKQVFLR